MLYVGLGRLDEALAAFRAAERLQNMLVTPHALTAQMREWLVLTLLRLGRLDEAREVLDDFSDQERGWGEARTALASVCLAEGNARAAAETLTDVLMAQFECSTLALSSRRCSCMRWRATGSGTASHRARRRTRARDC